MIQSLLKNGRLDRLAIGLSGLCLAHCLATSIVVALLASVSGYFLSPIVHEAGLAIAIILAAVALGHGARTHGLRRPLLIGIAGLLVMGFALFLGHGWHEAPLTMAGVSILAAGHVMNFRAAR
ncbi:MerC domain-containing protein [Rhizorhapis sp.]|uniref:MerC domain-containing protein n=1 Tax=Rhizorhapis sp. TaxID=1968842 RepID=UPI002B49CF77|nr:MerC domain-containing protein [Rhizorhapis sp.]HKR17242.1 MerC domain-containing protein [Rhizorhapis sp.]HKX36266.1 MerC domain-containing protein [Rhizorhapis sp.]